MPATARSFGDKTYNYAAIFEFADAAALKQYLSHPLHHELGRLFWEMCESTTIVEVELVRREERSTRRFSGVRPKLGRTLQKEVFDDPAQLRDRLGGVDRDAQLRSALEALRVPGAQRAQLVDDPALAAARRRGGRGGLARRACAGTPRPRRRARPAADRGSRAGTGRAPRATPASAPRRRAAVGRLREDPRIAQRAAADEHAADAVIAPAARRSGRPRRSRPIRTPEC